MVEILRGVSALWTILGGIVCFLLYLGALHQMIRSNNNAISRLFKDIQALHDFSIRSDAMNSECEKKFVMIVGELKEHIIESTSRYASLGVRIDDLFKLLGKRKDD